MRRSSRQPPTPTSASPSLAHPTAFPLPAIPGAARHGSSSSSSSHDRDGSSGPGGGGSRDDDAMDVDSSAGGTGRRGNPPRLRSKPSANSVNSSTGTGAGTGATKQQQQQQQQPGVVRSNSNGGGGRPKSGSFTSVGPGGAAAGKKKGSGSSATTGSGHTRRGSVSSKRTKKAAMDDDDVEGDDGSITRCVCGRNNTADMLMFQCETCNVWQHGPCVGLPVDNIQGDYFCEICRADLHVNGVFMPKARPTHGRSPSASHHTHATSRRERQATQDAVKLSQFLQEAGVPVEDMDELGGFAMPIAHTRRATMMDAAAATARNAAAHVVAGTSVVGGGRERVGSGESPGRELEGTEGGLRGRSKSAKERSKSPVPPSSTEIKRKRVSDDEDLSPLAVPSPMGATATMSLAGGENVKRMRVSPYDSVGSPSNSEVQSTAPVSVNGGGGIRRPEMRVAPVITTGPPMPGPHVSKPKHPNQYTYRPLDPNRKKEVVARKVSPMKKTSGPGGATARAKAARERAERETTPLDGGGWGLPEFLSHLQHLLPTASPKPISVPVPVSKAVAMALDDEDDGETPTEAVPATTAGDPESATTTTDQDKLASIVHGELPTQLEPSAKVRFPGKRMTMPDMRKRTKHLVDYLSRMLGESAEVKRRNKALEEAGVVKGMVGGIGQETERLIEELNEELVGWQDRFGA